MKKVEMLKAVVGKVEGLKAKDVEAVLKAFVEVVKEEVAQGGEVKLEDIATFKTKEVKGREGRTMTTTLKGVTRDIVIPTTQDHKSATVKAGPRP